MNLPENIVKPFSQGLQKLGFEGDDLLFWLTIKTYLSRF